MESDKLDKMLIMREEFMRALAEKNKSVLQAWPVDIKLKASQQAVRDTVLKGVEEIFESLASLKNWKPHRQTEISDFNREEFLEEYVDSLNYFFAALIMLGITSDELFEAYKRKDAIIHKRLETNY